jgi:hypothetical protein
MLRHPEKIYPSIFDKLVGDPKSEGSNRWAIDKFKEAIFSGKYKQITPMPLLLSSPLNLANPYNQPNVSAEVLQYAYDIDIKALDELYEIYDVNLEEAYEGFTEDGFFERVLVFQNGTGISFIQSYIYDDDPSPDPLENLVSFSVHISTDVPQYLDEEYWTIGDIY